jgi:hypothetical protein
MMNVCRIVDRYGPVSREKEVSIGVGSPQASGTDSEGGDSSTDEYILEMSS